MHIEDPKKPPLDNFDPFKNKLVNPLPDIFEEKKIKKKDLKE